MSHVILRANAAAEPVQLVGDDVVVSIEGLPTWTRAQWLESDLKTVGALVAVECRDHGIDPVIRVGGSASGYAALDTKSGVTDFGDPIKNFPWDIFVNELSAAYAQLPAASVPLSVVNVGHLYDKSFDDSTVELAAIHGDQGALEEVIAVAAGESASDSARAQAVLAQVDPAVLEAWDQAHGDAHQS